MYVTPKIYFITKLVAMNKYTNLYSHPQQQIIILKNNTNLTNSQKFHKKDESPIEPQNNLRQYSLINIFNTLRIPTCQVQQKASSINYITYTLNVSHIIGESAPGQISVWLAQQQQQQQANTQWIFAHPKCQPYWFAHLQTFGKIVSWLKQPFCNVQMSKKTASQADSQRIVLRIVLSKTLSLNMYTLHLADANAPGCGFPQCFQTKLSYQTISEIVPIIMITQQHIYEYVIYIFMNKSYQYTQANKKFNFNISHERVYFNYLILMQVCKFIAQYKQITINSHIDNMIYITQITLYILGQILKYTCINQTENRNFLAGFKQNIKILISRGQKILTALKNRFLINFYWYEMRIICLHNLYKIQVHKFLPINTSKRKQKNYYLAQTETPFKRKSQQRKQISLRE
eukprot:TRINITY_DN8029_c0_g1_i1.p1 TRINITY_DN8029_c0_g1~~TRINITY_DN8029_c0_g1_i1.p1  ORF type:complete len:402 (+),score=-17.76 TRINITY_DN8029_c0_g1_i1:271-1476(+)